MQVGAVCGCKASAVAVRAWAMRAKSEYTIPSKLPGLSFIHSEPNSKPVQHDALTVAHPWKWRHQTVKLAPTLTRSSGILLGRKSFLATSVPS